MAQLSLVMSQWILSEVPSSGYDLPHIYSKTPSPHLGVFMFPFFSFSFLLFVQSSTKQKEGQVSVPKNGSTEGLDLKAPSLQTLMVITYIF